MKTTTRKEIFVRYERCVGCHSCELACAMAHTSDKSLKELRKALAKGEKARKYLWVEQMGDMKVPTVCRQCEDAPCVAVCPTGAMHKKDENTNVCNLQQCIGCWMCALACPFGAIGRSEDGKVLKCDRECLDEEGIPACVRACKTGALVFMTVEEFEAERRREAVASLIN